MQPDVFETYLERYGWTYKRLTGTTHPTWSTGFEAESDTYPLVIHLTDSYLGLRVSPLVRFRGDLTKFPRMLLELMRLNSSMKMVHIGLEACGSVALVCEIPRADLSYEALETAIGVLGYYVDEISAWIDDFVRQSGLREGPPSLD